MCGIFSKVNMWIFQNYIKPYDIICISETKQNYIDKHEFKGNERFCHTVGGIYYDVMLDALYGNKVILMGDFNSRTGEISDILEVDKFDIDYLDDDIVNMYNTEYSLPPRCNEDKIINQQGKALIELCKSTDLKIINGRYGNDRNIGSYTCYKYKWQKCC